MIDEEQVRSISKKVLDEEHLLGFIKIFEKEHNLFRGSHDKIGLPETIVIPQPIINQIVEKFDTKLTEGSIPIIDEDGHFTEDNDKLFYDEEKKILCLGLKSPATDMVGGFCMKAETPPTINIEDAIQVYALDCPLERLTDGGLEEWAGAEDLTYWTEFDTVGPGAVNREASEVHGGSFSCRLHTIDAGDFCGFYQYFSLTPGNNCKITIWYLRPAHASSNLRLYIQTDPQYITYLKPDGTWTTEGYDIIYLTTTEVWKKFELEFKAHPDYSSYRIKFYKDHTAGGPISYYVDDVSVAEIGNIIPYFRTSTGIVIGLNQDLRTTADITLAGLTLTDFSGVLKAVAGVVTGGADHADLGNITSDQHHPQAHSHAHGELTGVQSGQHHPQLHAASHLSAGGDAIKLDDLASPDDNVDLNASTAKHGLLMKLGGGAINFLRADGTWALPAGGNGATTFLGLTDTPANYTGAGNKIVKVNATPDALVFGADISDLEDVDSITGQAGKYARVKAADAGVEWVAGTGNSTFPDLTDTPEDYVDQAGKFCKVKAGEDGLEFAAAGDGGGYGKEVIDEIFDSLIDGDIHGQGVYSGWAAWNTDVEDADCSAQIVANPGNGKMLRLTDANINGLINTKLDADAGCEIVQCLFKCKMRISTLASTDNRGYIGIWDKAAQHAGIYFKDNALQWYTGSASVSIIAAVANTWYSVEIFMDCTGGKAVIWVDGVLKLTGQSCQIQDIESFSFYTKAVSPVGGYTFEIDDLFIVDLTRKS